MITQSYVHFLSYSVKSTNHEYCDKNNDSHVYDDVTF